MATIAQNLATLQQARTDIAEAITDKGVTLAQGAGFTDFPQAIEDIPTGVDTSNDTVTPETLAEGMTAHDASGAQIEGTMQGGLEMNVKFAEGSKEIPDFMFYHIVSGTKKESSKITEVVIGDGITKIGQQAFYRCPITSVKLPNGLKEIGIGAFGSTKLTNVIIPDSVEIIHGSDSNRAFTGNVIKYENGIGYVDTWVVIVDNTTPQTVEIKNGTRGIAYYAFYQNNTMTSITIPNSVIFINGFAFQNCTNLTSITIPDSVTSIGNSAFWSCTSLTSATIGNSVTSINYGTFQNCKNLTSATIGNSVTSIGTYAFAYCTSLTSITIPDSVTSIGNSAFFNCNNLKTITINKSSGSISGAPWGATNATVVWIG